LRHLGLFLFHLGLSFASDQRMKKRTLVPQNAYLASVDYSS
jgi:hypothetical protein